MSWVPQSTCSANRRAHVAGKLPILLLALTVASCNQFGTDRERLADDGVKLSPVLRRMQETYRDLKSGRFVSLASLERPEEVQLFRTVDASGSEQAQPQPTLSVLRSRNETGAGSLKVRLTDTHSELRLDGVRSDELALLRDWQPYPLMMMSVYGPVDGLQLEITIASGKPATLTWTRRLELVHGWNLLRFDVGVIGRTIDLADVRLIALRAPEINSPTEIHVDDVILADNTKAMFGEGGANGSLYVFRRGTRTHVGAYGRFELTFLGSFIDEWRDGNGVRLSDPAGLGPWPIVAAGQDEQPATLTNTHALIDAALCTTWDSSPEVETIVGASKFCVSVRGTRRWRSYGPGSRGAGRVHCRHFIEPSGRVISHLRVESDTASRFTTNLSYWIGLDNHHGFQTVQPTPARRGSACYTLLTQPDPQQADLLWTCPAHDADDLPTVHGSGDGRRVALLVPVGDSPDTRDFVHCLRLWPTDIDSAAVADPLARDYRQPVALRPSAGVLVTDAEGDRDHDGFNETFGWYELRPADRVLRFEFDPGGLLRFQPAFRVHETSEHRCWVYARGQLLADTARDPFCDLLFRLPGTISRPALIEVHADSPEPE